MVYRADDERLGRTVALKVLQEGNLEAYRGHALMLAGRLDEALPALRTGAAACQFDPGVMTFMHAHLWLGEALEAKGDTAGACTNYAVVTQR